MQKLPTSDASLAALISAALAGSRVVMEFYGTDFSVAYKADNSPVSEADVGSQRAIAESLASSLPGLPMVGEEEAAGHEHKDFPGAFVLVDPLDGTKEFISRNGEFTVNVAIIEDGAPVSGVVLAPAIGLAYAANRSTAWKGALPADSSEITQWAEIRARSAGEHPVAVVSRSHMNPATANALAQVGCVDHRSIGSSLKFCLLAEGDADFYPRLGTTMEWDIAAGDAVLRAAGGSVVALDGTPLRYGKRAAGKMRDFENPYFMAVGDRALIERLDLVSLGAA